MLSTTSSHIQPYHSIPLPNRNIATLHGISKVVELDKKSQQISIQFHNNYQYESLFHSPDNNQYLTTNQQHPFTILHRNTIQNGSFFNNDYPSAISEITIPNLNHNSSSQVYNQYTTPTSQF